MTATKKEQEAIIECYKRLYAEAEPSADFDELMRQASLNERGEREIPFMHYEIPIEKMNRIIEEVANEYKLSSIKKRMFKTTIYLGCSPKSKTND